MEPGNTSGHVKSNFELRFRLAIGLLTVVWVANGCSNPTALFPNHVVAIDSDGGLRSIPGEETDPALPGAHKLIRNPRPNRTAALGEADDRAMRTYTHRSHARTRSIFKDPALEHQTNILIFIQGGLNDVNNGIERANKLTAQIMSDPTNPAYPIFIAWDASLPSAWREQYTTHRGGNASTATAVVLAPFTFVANVGRFVTRLPLSAVEQGYAGLRTASAPAFTAPNASEYYLKRAAAVQQRYREMTNDGFKLKFTGGGGPGDFYTKGLLMVAQTPPKILAEGIVDTGGKVGWDFMIRRTKTMFTTANTFSPGGLDYFARDLVSYLKQPENRGKTVTIVGHSMGAIVANEFVRRYGDDLPIANIVYMAAACGMDEFERTVIPYLAAHHDCQFYNLCLHPANDSSELTWWWTEPIAPRGSLLDWIDAYYSSAETDYGWTLGKWENAILGSYQFLRPLSSVQAKAQFQMKSFGYGSESRYGPQHHGGFDNWKFWLPAFWEADDANPAPLLNLGSQVHPLAADASPP